MGDNQVIADDVVRLIFQNQAARLHSGMIDGEPVLVTEYPNRPTYVIMSNDIHRQAAMEDRMGVNFDLFNQTYMGLTIAIVNRKENILEVK